MRNGWLPSDYTDLETMNQISNSCYRETSMQSTLVPTSRSLSFGFVCVVFVVLGSVLVLVASYWRDMRRRRQFNYVNISETHNVPVYSVYPQYTAITSWAKRLSGVEGKKETEGRSDRQIVIEGRREGKGIDVESKGESARREAASHTLTHGSSSVEKAPRAPSVIQMTEIPYQQ